MTNWLIHIYSFFEQHRRLLYSLMALFLLLTGIALTRFRSDEEITAFLPMDDSERKAMGYYAEYSDADRIVVIFEDTAARRDLLMAAVDSFAAHYDQNLPQLHTSVDFSDYLDVIDSIYRYMPLFLDADDYARMDSLLARDGYIDEQMEANQEALIFPLSSFAEHRIQVDPLNLFSPVMERLRNFIPASDAFVSSDGYIFSSDGKMAFAWLVSPYGQTETDKNADLVENLNLLSENTQASFPAVSIRTIGAPVVAVGNAHCIKRDSILASIIAVILICIILWLKLRNVRSILLILLTVAFGWLVAVALLSTVYGTISMIVIGIGSILIGIAVNYPLHVVMHNNFTSDIRSNLKEIAEPLIIGNITTVGAFCSLLPLEAQAMRQLGIFAIALLVGTISFSVFFLPHFLPEPKAIECESLDIASGKTALSRLNKPLLAIVAVLTIFFALYVPSTSFDSDLSNMNFMTAQQRADFARFAHLAGHDNSNHRLFIIHDNGSWNDNCLKCTLLASTLDSMSRCGLLSSISSASRYLPSDQCMHQRMLNWNLFVTRHRYQLHHQLPESAASLGFTSSAFSPFMATLNPNNNLPDSTFFIKVASTIFHANVRGNKIADICYVDPRNEQSVIDRLSPYATVFTAENINQRCISTLSDDFNFIGLVCSIIVFVFLWVSFRNLALALIAFIPMALSWIWILGIMGIANMQFNIVNIILATFIFGQGDDYTIFMVNGIVHQHDSDGNIMRQFANEILTSAAIMLAGIGTLAISLHPAIHSLGIVTLIGMGCVVLMAFILPPALYSLYRKLLKSKQQLGTNV